MVSISWYMSKGAGHGVNVQVIFSSHCVHLMFIMVISEPTQFVAGRFEKPLRFASNQQMQINIFSFFKKKKPIHAESVHVGLIPAQSYRQPPVISVINALEIVRVDLV